MTAMILFLSGIMLWVKMFVINKDTMPKDWQMEKRNKTYWVVAGLIGVVTGGLSGTFGIGSTPFIQSSCVRSPLVLKWGRNGMAFCFSKIAI
jgi:uncharacterized membrane protein YfcA